MARYTRAKAKITSSTGVRERHLGAALVGRRHRGGAGARERQHRRDHRRLDRPAGGVVDGPRVEGRVRPARSTSRGSSGRCCCCSWPACSTGAGSCRCETSTCSRSRRSRSRSGTSTRGSCSGASRSSTRRSIYLFVAARGDRLRPGRGGRVHHALARLAGRGAGGVRDGLPGRPQLLVLQRDRRRLRQRGGLGPAAVRHDPLQPHAEGHGHAVRAEVLRRLVLGLQAGRRRAASRRSSAATPTGPSCTTRTCR